MSRRANKGSKTGIVFVMMLAAATGLGVLTAYVRTNPTHLPMPAQRERVDPSEQVDQDLAEARTHRRVAKSDTVRVAALSGTDVALSEEPVAVPTGQDKLTFAANETLKAFGHSDARVLAVTLEGSVAHVQVNSKAATGWGSMEESQFVKAMQLTFGQFSNVDKVEFYLDGQKLDTLGHFEVQDGVEVSR